MKKNQLLRFLPVAVAACVGAQFPARAGTESFSANFGMAGSPLLVSDSGGLTPDFPVNVSLPTFDTSLGNLSDVTITLSMNGSLQSEVINTGPTAGFTGAAASGTISVTGPAGVNVSLPLSTTPFNGSLAAGSLLLASYTLGTPALGSGTTTLDVPQADFSSYESGGGSDELFPVSADLTSTLFSGTGNVFFGGKAEAYGSVEVTYAYAVAEPWTLWPELSLPGICTLAGCARIRRARCGASRH